MASLDNLPADQRAVLSLVLQRGRTFDQIAELLSVDRASVRQRALEGFDALGPETTLEPLKRALITDYLLGQLPPAVAENVAGSLAKSPTERAWARVIAAEISPLAKNGLPEIPAAAAHAAPAPPAPAPAPATIPEAEPEPVTDPAPAQSPAATPVGRATVGGGPDPRDSPAGAPAGPRSSRRGGAILLGLIVLVVVVVVVILLVTGGSSKKSSTTTGQAAAPSTSSVTSTGTTTTGTGTSTNVQTLHTIEMVPPTTVKGREGAAAVVKANGTLGLVIAAEGLAANTNNAYAVWLYNSKTQKSVRLGFYSQKVAATGKTKGDLEAEVKLPSGATAYNELLLTLETSEKPNTPGTIVLEGSFAE